MFEPKYTISDQIVNKLSEIAEIKAMVERFRLLPVKEVFLKQAAVVKIAHTSTSIEGNHLAEYQMAKLPVLMLSIFSGYRKEQLKQN